MSDCVFCKIISGEFQCMKVYEDESTLAFMDTAKDVDGHILAVPKQHFTNILDCDDKALAALMKTVKKISCHLTENCGYDGVNLLNASGTSAGQSVPHFHIHIIPRRKNDGINAWPDFKGAENSIGYNYSKVVIK